MKFIGNLVCYICLMLFVALALSVMWGWFVVPLGVPSVGYAHALGLSLIGSMLAGGNRTKNKSDDDSFTDLVMLGFIHTLIMFGLGYIIHLFM